MSRPDCENCGGTGVSFGKRCACLPGEAPQQAINAGCALERSDAARLEWALPILVGATDATADQRTIALASALLAGFDGRDAIDQAMKISRTKPASAVERSTDGKVGGPEDVASSVVITLRQAQALVAFFGGNDCEVTVTERPSDWGDEAPSGLYAYCTEYPAEGTEYLGKTEADDSAGQQGGSDSADANADEALEILNSLIKSIEQHGNYSKESTLGFLGQIRQCLAAILKFPPSGIIGRDVGIAAAHGPTTQRTGSPAIPQPTPEGGGRPATGAGGQS